MHRTYMHVHHRWEMSGLHIKWVAESECLYCLAHSGEEASYHISTREDTEQLHRTWRSAIDSMLCTSLTSSLSLVQGGPWNRSGLNLQYPASKGLVQQFPFWERRKRKLKRIERVREKSKRHQDTRWSETQLQLTVQWAEQLLHGWRGMKRREKEGEE